MSEQHAKYSPSKLPRLLTCPASFALTEKCKDKQIIPKESKTSEAAREGTIYHEIVADILNRDINDYMPFIKVQCEKENVPVEYDAIKTCVEYARSLFNQASLKKIEHKVTLASIGFKDVYGTADLIIEGQDNNLLYIVDWKFGKGVYVDEESVQLKAYAIGALLDTKDWYRIKTVKAVIVQPRYVNTEPVRVKTYDVPTLLSWVDRELAPAIYLADHGLKYQVSSHCRWCPVKFACAHHTRSITDKTHDMFKMYAKVESSDEALADTVPIEELCQLYEVYISVLSPFMSSLGKHLASQLHQGKDVPGFKLVQGRSIRKWKDIKDLEKFIKDSMGLELSDISESKLMGPAKVEKLVEPDLRKDLSKLIIKPEGKPKMAPNSDYRPAIENPFHKYINQED